MKWLDRQTTAEGQPPLLLSAPLVGTWYLYGPTNIIERQRTPGIILAAYEDWKNVSCFPTFISAPLTIPDPHTEKKNFAVGSFSLEICQQVVHLMDLWTVPDWLHHVIFTWNSINKKEHHWHKEIHGCNLGFPITRKLYDIHWESFRYVVDMSASSFTGPSHFAAKWRLPFTKSPV